MHVCTPGFRSATQIRNVMWMETKLKERSNLLKPFSAASDKQDGGRAWLPIHTRFLYKPQITSPREVNQLNQDVHCTAAGSQNDTIL